MTYTMQMKKREMRERRHRKVRTKLHGTKAIPRLSVFRSNRYIYAQLIDDTAGRTVVSASDTAQTVKGKTKVDRAREVGILIARQAKEKHIASAVFDRGGFLYAGRIKALAEGAREGGLKI